MKARAGALLKIEYEKGMTGYADCHPWVELGDQPLARQLELLREGVTTPLTARSLQVARLDAEARSSQRSLLAEIKLLKNHCLLPDLTTDVPSGFSRIKVKVGRNPAEEIPLLKEVLAAYTSRVRWRLDFNNHLSRADFVAYLDAIAPWRENIDYFEDPFPYDAGKWLEIEKHFHVSLACDAASHDHLDDNSHTFSVIKPAVQPSEPFAAGHGKKLVVTSYLDHPLGQLSAAYFAAELNRKHNLSHCGLITHMVYQPNPYSERFSVEDEALIPPVDGLGFGFDDLLHKEKWRPL